MARMTAPAKRETFDHFRRSALEKYADGHFLFFSRNQRVRKTTRLYLVPYKTVEILFYGAKSKLSWRQTSVIIAKRNAAD